MSETKNAITNPTAHDSFAQIMERRSFLKGLTTTASVVAVNALTGQRSEAAVQTGLNFAPVSLSNEDRIITPSGYRASTVISWGDAIFPGVPAFDINNQTAEKQARQFGYNCDFVYLIEFPRRSFVRNRREQRSGLLWVNHEYTNPELMFYSYRGDAPTKEQVDIQLAAHGGSLVQVDRVKPSVFGQPEWTPNVYSQFNRRLTAETPCRLTGPAAGHALVKTAADPTGLVVRGTLNNCGGGRTPWNTIVTAEENFDQYFANAGKLDAADPRRAMHARIGLPTGANEYRWDAFYERFDVSKEPNEAFRFGYVVEIDPLNPNGMPKKRTALGRFKHEACTFAVAPDQRVVAYTGDDQRFEYVYKFVTKGTFNPANGPANGDLLDEGTLYVARYNDDGTGVWLPLIGGQGALVAWSQAEICINTRAAADLLGATRMDRPEDIEVNPVNGKVYGAFTNNTQRGTAGRAGTDKANPRAVNRHGHIIEMTEANNDPTSTTFRWEIFMLCGDPAVATDGTYFAGYDPKLVSAISSPDNIAFDQRGNLWIATDGQANTLRKNDGIYAVPTQGAERGNLKMFLSSVVGCETSSLALSEDNMHLFVSIQHPAEGSTIATPSSRFPDGDVPRPSVIVVENTSGTRAIGL